MSPRTVWLVSSPGHNSPQREHPSRKSEDLHKVLCECSVSHHRAGYLLLANPRSLPSTPVPARHPTVGAAKWSGKSGELYIFAPACAIHASSDCYKQISTHLHRGAQVSDDAALLILRLRLAPAMRKEQALLARLLDVDRSPACLTLLEVCSVLAVFIQGVLSASLARRRNILSEGSTMVSKIRGINHNLYAH